jgi:hypothetical protein
MLDELSQRLLALHAEKNIERFPWADNCAVLARVLREGVVLRPNPRTVLYNIGDPLWCHANALRGGKLFGVETLGGVPWFGFRFMDDCTYGKWWCHSFVSSGSLWIDSAPPSVTSLYFAMPYDAELFRMLWPEDEDLPAILTSAPQSN